MSRPTGSTKACERYEQLRRREAETKLTEPSDQQFLQTHPEACTECQILRTVLETIQWPDADVGDADAAAAPWESIDELSRRRLINDVVARVDEAPARMDEASARMDEAPTRMKETPAPRPTAGVAPGASKSLPQASYRHYGYIAAACAVLIGLTILWSPWQRGPAQELRVYRSTATSQSTRYLLLAGAVRTSAGSAALGHTLEPGQWLETSPAGSAVLRLPGGATVLLEGHTRIRLGVGTIALKRGALLALVDPQRPGSRFAVVTAHGRVEVTGTVFGVTACDARSRAAVLRGRVQVTSEGKPAMQLLAGHQIIIGAQRTTPVTAVTSGRLWQQVRLLDLLKSHRPATLVVTSRPTGARVVVDDVPLGNTPLVVSLRPGHRRLELATKNHEAVREHVLLKAHAKTSRDFDLNPTRPAQAAHTSIVQPPRIRPSALRRRSQKLRGRPPKHTSTHTPNKPPRDLRRALLNRAQILRADRDWRGAPGAYRALIRRYPGTAEGATALVSLGILQLRHLGQPARALRAFERYLKGSGRGALAREAAYGQLLALRSLGQRTREIRALRRFLKRYPRALRAAKVKRRLAKLNGGAKSAPRSNPSRAKP